MRYEDLNLDELLDLIVANDRRAVQEILERHKPRLEAMVVARMDPRLRPRVDTSDVVQETFIKATKGILEYARARPIQFYPWLREIAMKCLIDLYRRHIAAGKRAIDREARNPGLRDESVFELVEGLSGSLTSPSMAFQRAEQAETVQKILRSLAENDREIIVQRFLEHMSIDEIAATFGIKVGATKTRLFRALQRFREHWDMLSNDV